jgi:MHS family alpha-ketoglutarate permease-like MFS transporter
MTSAPAAGKKDRREASGFAGIMAGAFGNLVEWYDWITYGLLASVFAPVIFPSGDPSVGLIQALVTFAVGFAIRPIGALVLSPLADRYGRRRMLAFTILMMGVGSLIIGLTPGYEQIGIAAPIIMLLARLLQGFSAGGEFQTASAFLVEHAKPHRRGLVGSSQLIGIGLATLLANGTAALITNVMPEAALQSWGWRLPFILGFVLSLFGLFLRRKVAETPQFQEIEQKRQIARRPLIEALKADPMAFLRVGALETIATVPYYLWSVFLPTYANLTSGLPLDQGFAGSTIGVAVFTALLPLFAQLSDKKLGRKPLVLGATIGFVVLSYPMFLLLQIKDFKVFLLVALVGFILMAAFDSVLATVLAEQFPTRTRASGIGVAYNIAAVLFGGTTPLIAAEFIREGLPLGVAYYLIVLSVLCGVVFARMPETRGITLK